MTLKELFFAGLGALLVGLALPQWFCLAAEKDGGFVTYPTGPGAPGPVVFSHQAHGPRGAGYPCAKCHAPAATTIPPLDGIHRGQACGWCHDGKTTGRHRPETAASIQSCSACHMPAADIVFSLNRMDPVAFSHVRHLGIDANKKTSRTSGLSCCDCHPVPFERTSKGPLGMDVPHESGGCAQCHNGKKRGAGTPPAFAANTRCLTCHKPH